jgi:hypothetical protein
MKKQNQSVKSCQEYAKNSNERIIQFIEWHRKQPFYTNKYIRTDYLLEIWKRDKLLDGLAKLLK